MQLRSFSILVIILFFCGTASIAQSKKKTTPKATPESNSGHKNKDEQHPAPAAKVDDAAGNAPAGQTTNASSENGNIKSIRGTGEGSGAGSDAGVGLNSGVGSSAASSSGSGAIPVD